MTSLFQDQLWIHFGDGRRRWHERCALCQGHTRATSCQLPQEALSCWKVEIWYSAWAHPDLIDDVLFEWAMEAPSLAGKLSLEPLTVVASDPVQAPYPDPGPSRVALIYACDSHELATLQEEVELRLVKSGAGPGKTHFRRGCWAYDETYSPWTSWTAPSTN